MMQKDDLTFNPQRHSTTILESPPSILCWIANIEANRSAQVDYLRLDVGHFRFKSSVIPLLGYWLIVA